MDVLRRLGTERARQVAMELLVRPVVVPADDVRDSELDVVDDAGQLVLGGSVLPKERDLSETIAPKPIRAVNSAIPGMKSSSGQPLSIRVRIRQSPGPTSSITTNRMTRTAWRKIGRSRSHRSLPTAGSSS